MVKVTSQTNNSGLLRKALKWAVRQPANKYVCGAVGVAGTAVALSSVAKDGMAKGMRDARDDQGNFYKKLFDNSGSSAYYSHMLEDVKGGVRQTLFDHWLYPAISIIKNVPKSIAVEAVRNIDTMAASVAAVGALFMNKHPHAQKAFGVLGAGYLVLKGGYTFMRDVMGFGKNSS